MARTVHLIYDKSVASVYPAYVNKLERKGHTEAELVTVLSWLTGFTAQELSDLLATDINFREFFDSAKLHPNAEKITGSICGVKIQEIEDPLMKKIRYLDKLVDEVANGRPMEKVLRS